MLFLCRSWQCQLVKCQKVIPNQIQQLDPYVTHTHTHTHTHKTHVGHTTYTQDDLSDMLDNSASPSLVAALHRCQGQHLCTCVTFLVSHVANMSRTCREHITYILVFPDPSWHFISVYPSILMSMSNVKWKLVLCHMHVPHSPNLKT